MTSKVPSNSVNLLKKKLPTTQRGKGVFFPPLAYLCCHLVAARGLAAARIPGDVIPPPRAVHHNSQQPPRRLASRGVCTSSRRLRSPPAMKILVGCARRHLVLFRPRCLQNSRSPQLWKRGHQVLRSFQSPTILQQEGSPWAPSLRGVQPRWLSNVDLSQRDPKPPSSSENSEKFAVIYRFPAIRLLKLFSRLKILQTGFGLLIFPPLWYFHGLSQFPLVIGLFSFTLVFLYAISFFLQRVIGFMYLNESGTLLKISHLTFWGKRRNFCCPVESVTTLGDEGKYSSRFLLKFRQYDQKKVLYFSLVLGQVVDHEAFDKVFGCYT